MKKINLVLSYITIIISSIHISYGSQQQRQTVYYDCEKCNQTHAVIITRPLCVVSHSHDVNDYRRLPDILSHNKACVLSHNKACVLSHNKACVLSKNESSGNVGCCICICCNCCDNRKKKDGHSQQQVRDNDRSCNAACHIF